MLSKDQWTGTQKISVQILALLQITLDMSLNHYESQIFNQYYKTETKINDKIIKLDN